MKWCTQNGHRKGGNFHISFQQIYFRSSCGPLLLFRSFGVMCSPRRFCMQIWIKQTLLNLLWQRQIKRLKTLLWPNYLRNSQNPDSHQAGAMSLTDLCTSSISFVLTNFHSVFGWSSSAHVKRPRVWETWVKHGIKQNPCLFHQKSEARRRNRALLTTSITQNQR